MKSFTEEGEEGNCDPEADLLEFESQAEEVDRIRLRLRDEGDRLLMGRREAEEELEERREGLSDARDRLRWAREEAEEAEERVNKAERAARRAEEELEEACTSGFWQTLIPVVGILLLPRNLEAKRRAEEERNRRRRALEKAKKEKEEKDDNK